MMRWVLENNVIVGRDIDRYIIPNVKQIYNAGTSIEVENELFDFAVDNIRFSKVIGLNVLISFKYYKVDEILCSLKAKKNNELYDIATYDGQLLGYSIIDGVWHYLNSEYDIIVDAFSKLEIKLNSKIDYFSYISITKELKQCHIDYNDDVLDNIDKLKSIVQETRVDSLNDLLFPYQKIGVNWLNFMSDGSCGCILGDEMGLGKTLQVIALLQSRKIQNRDAHFLVAAPVSLLVNWKREISKFCPQLSVIIHHGAKRICFYKDLLDFDVVITSYGNAQTDLSMLKMIEWDIFIIDEAQNVKNPYSKRRNNLNELRRRMTVAMTGTPFENHVSDIWSISDFVLPGYFGKLSDFESNYEDDLYSAKEIEKILSPIMIRRRVSEVADCLPEKVEISQPIVMGDDEANYYENERNEFVGVDALNQRSIELIQGLRMFCSHPMVYRDDLINADPERISNKYKRTCEILDEVFSYGEKVLIFTSFNKMIDIFCNDLPRRFGVKTMFINGDVGSTKRQAIIDEFSKIKGSAVLVLNPKAAGAGLNITSANHVIHYNLEWNPAIEAQASARAYRRGQEKTVFIYRLYYTGTIEEFVNEKIEHKQELFDTAIVGNNGETFSSDLVQALSYSPKEGC